MLGDGFDAKLLVVIGQHDPSMFEPLFGPLNVVN